MESELELELNSSWNRSRVIPRARGIRKKNLINLLWLFLLPVNAYVYGNHRKSSDSFRKLCKCLKTVSYALKKLKNLRESLEEFGNLWKFAES